MRPITDTLTLRARWSLGQVDAVLAEIPERLAAIRATGVAADRFLNLAISSVMLSYTDAVNFYRTALKQRGDELFQSPPTHQFEVARFRDQDMAFPPSVTIKDYTWGGSAGYVNSTGGQPAHFPTIIQIVPLPVAR